MKEEQIRVDDRLYWRNIQKILLDISFTYS